MENLEALAAKCRAMLAAIGIQAGCVERYTLNTRAKSRLGQCRRLPGGSFEIELSASLFSEDAPRAIAVGTMLHELLHTVPGCFAHRGKWSVLAARVNAAYAQYPVRATLRRDILPFLPTASPCYRYAILCTKCGSVCYRQKQSAPCKYPARYRCTKCGGRLRVEYKETGFSEAKEKTP